MVSTFRAPVAVVLSKLLLASALLAISDNFNPSMPTMQPNTGIGQADDSGAGPISLNGDTWNANNIDSIMRKFWDSGFSKQSNYHSHHEFADQHCVYPSCANKFTNCEGDPGSCPQPKEGAESKTQGHVGIKAMMAAVEQFLLWEKIVSNGPDISKSLQVDFQQALAPPDIPCKVRFKLLAGAVGLVAGRKRSANPRATFICVLMALWMFAVINVAINIGEAANATTAVREAYKSAEGNVSGIVQRVVASKLLETTWRDSFSSFLIYIPGVIDDCQKWHTNTGPDDALRYCAPTGMFLLHSIYPNRKGFGFPPGASNEIIARIGNRNMQLQDLFASSADTYLNHGLINTSISYFLPEIILSWFKQPDDSIFRHQGMFTLPVCELQSYNWRQGDSVGTSALPCECLTAQDKRGNKFMEIAQDDVKNWMNKFCH